MSTFVKSNQTKISRLSTLEKIFFPCLLFEAATCLLFESGTDVLCYPLKSVISSSDYHRKSVLHIGYYPRKNVSLQETSE